MTETRHNWTIEEIEKIYHTPFLELLFEAAAMHRKYHPKNEVQMCQLISIKTGGCPEDCKYCSQSSRYETATKPEPMMKLQDVLTIAERAKSEGASRICLGAAWKSPKDSPQFDKVLEMVSEITKMGLEVCCTLGMLSESQAEKLKKAGLYAYNHNLDSSEEFYKTIITTRTYQDRLNTLDVVEKAGITTCSGGILGMGETVEDRLKMLQTFANREKHPDSLPINRLVAIPGTPLEDRPSIDFFENARLIATARLMMPKTVIRLSAGRQELSLEQQALLFLAGANSIFSGEKLLTVGNPAFNKDLEMFKTLGLKPKKPALFAKAS